MPIGIEEQIKRTGIDISYPGEDSMKLFFKSPLGYDYSVQVDFEDSSMRSSKGDGSLNKHVVLPRIHEVVQLHESEVDRMAKERIMAGEANAVSDILRDCHAIQNKFINMDSLLQSLDEYNKAEEMAAESDHFELYSNDIHSMSYRTAVRNRQEEKSFDTHKPGGRPDDFDVYGKLMAAENELADKLTDSVAPGRDIVVLQYSENPDRVSVKTWLDGNDLGKCVNFVRGMHEHDTPFTLYVDKKTGELECTIEDSFSHTKGKYRFRRMTPDFTEELETQFHHDLHFPVEDIIEMTQPVGPEIADVFGIDKEWEVESENAERMEDDSKHNQYDTFADKVRGLEGSVSRKQNSEKGNIIQAGRANSL